jgi:signal transduction histidine kinase
MTSASLRPELTRPRSSVLGGVCAGLAAHLGVSERGVRLVLVCATVAGGAGALLYLWLWALVPLESDRSGASAAVNRRVPVAVVLVALAVAFVLGEIVGLVARRDAAVSVALLGVIIGGGGAVAWSLIMDAADPGRSLAYATGVRSAATFVLLVAGIVALVSPSQGFNAALGMVSIVVAVGVLVAPRLVALWSALLTERAGRVREEQRAEIAAHLHDSVLQTLALIQTRAGASSEVARIARAQERELRDWLFAEDIPARVDLATELREIAAAIELDYPVRIDVVTAGTAIDRVPTAVVGASREAMLNAARHAGGEVAVYVETTTDSIDVFIRDRGPGVDMATLPDDRLGIRESIVGRMVRAGGSASVRPGAAGSGTEVHLHLATTND